jgi:hypothetical protein
LKPSFSDLRGLKVFAFQAPHWSRTKPDVSTLLPPIERPEMRKLIPGSLAPAVLIVLFNCTGLNAAVTRTEQFASDPLNNGWEARGDTNLIRWVPADQNLRVTWDSSKANTYLRWPLGNIVTSEDDFSFSADLLLHDFTAGVRPEFPGTFQIAFGFQNRADADKLNFIRGTGADSPNLVEFNYFPDSGFGPTVWPAMIPTNGVMNYSGTGDFSIFALPPGVPMKISLAYAASNHTVTLTITTNGAVVGQVVDAPLVDVQRGFRLDAFAIASYSEFGQNPQYPGSVLAHGAIDNIEIIIPPRPLGETTGRLISGEWIHEFETLPGWRYRLESSEDLVNWSEVGGEVNGTGTHATLRATNQSNSSHRFFRVKATR